jgi:hypothetical protein
MKDCKESFEREAERVKELLAAEPEAEPTQFVRLSEEEVTEILTSAYDMYSTICAVENRLVEKNNPPRPEPATRKPMTEEEISRYLDNECLADFDARIFKWAISIAEKHHGVGGDDNG